MLQETLVHLPGRVQVPLLPLQVLGSALRENPVNHRLDPLHRHEKKPSLAGQFKYTLGTVVALGTMTGIMFADYGSSALWYAIASAILVVAVFTGEVFRK